ncbi:uncharacterized protein AKAW2_80534A [Aspergillus luchuensis]|uniref:Uncharacterized protein n=1 Tax=Aspergillus kawachii TaxID=1069201 RepID=A0A7R8A5C6_ASPKA|nr:uncharacterized protein AKAW2_80534A [Aspergillus luchuensis]BCS04733.1 hypothetical protein AKAW2_80534A [Aspergillus luchuensis]BCS16303.1 hypothetical protein ALUC_80510A [Aspergillus luchuensis]
MGRKGQHGKIEDGDMGDISRIESRVSQNHEFSRMPKSMLQNNRFLLVMKGTAKSRSIYVIYRTPLQRHTIQAGMTGIGKAAEDLESDMLVIHYHLALD